MLFNSAQFFVFFAVVYVAYLCVHQRIQLRNLLLLSGSYFFYGWWDSRFLALLVGSTLFDYVAGLKIAAADGPKRKRWIVGSIVFNLGLLGIFKYYDFFADSLSRFGYQLGWRLSPFELNVILPVGISFYTFQTLSYSIDVYRGKIEPTRNLLNFATYVAFFPQLVAGPIERASRLLPQICGVCRMTRSKLNVGIYLVLWGFFKKTVVADNLAPIVNEVFGNAERYNTVDFLIASVAFAFQIYGDFSGYSDIARGLSKLLGFDLMVNFRLPYFSCNPSDFWQRWHISLSSWLRDYLYIPLGGNRGSEMSTYRNLMLTMLLGGLWHGAAWNFLLWGGFHGVVLVLYRRIAMKTSAQPRRTVGLLASWGLMTFLTLIGWVLFRIEAVSDLGYITRFDMLFNPHALRWLFLILFFVTPQLVLESWQQYTRDLLIVVNSHWLISGFVYGFLLTWIVVFGVREATEFIYFQF